MAGTTGAVTQEMNPPMCEQSSRTASLATLSLRHAEAIAYYDLCDSAKRLGVPTALDDPRSPKTVAELVTAVRDAQLVSDATKNIILAFRLAWPARHDDPRIREALVEHLGALRIMLGKPAVCSVCGDRKHVCFSWERPA